LIFTERGRLSLPVPLDIISRGTIRCTPDVAVPPRRALFLSGEPVTSTDLYEQSRPISATKSDYAPLRPLVNWIRKINYQENEGGGRREGKQEETAYVEEGEGERQRR